MLDTLLLHFFLYCSALHRDLPSFPTRRSSDLRYARTSAICWRDIVPGLSSGIVVFVRSSISASVAPSKSAEDDDAGRQAGHDRSEEHTSELQSRVDLVCRLLLEKKNKDKRNTH